MPIISLQLPRNDAAHVAPRKYVLVLSCVDARLLDDLVHFLDHDNLTNRYYHVTLPGTALGLTNRVMQENISNDLKSQFRRWRKTFIDQVQAAVTLTKGELTDIYIIQHEDCGAFKVYLHKDSAEMDVDEELSMHRDYAGDLLEDIAENFCTAYNAKDKDGNWIQKKKPFVHTFYMNLRGQVTHFESRPDHDHQEHCTSEKKKAPKPPKKVPKKK